MENEDTTAKIQNFADYLRSQCGINADVDLYHSSKNTTNWSYLIQQECKKGFIILIWSDTMDKMLNHVDVNDNSSIQMASAHISRQSLLSLIDERRQYIVVVCLDSDRELVSIKERLPSNLKQGTVHSISLPMMLGNQVIEHAGLRNLISVLTHQQQFEKPGKQLL